MPNEVDLLPNLVSQILEFILVKGGLLTNRGVFICFWNLMMVWCLIIWYAEIAHHFTFRAKQEIHTCRDFYVRATLSFNNVGI